MPENKKVAIILLRHGEDFRGNDEHKETYYWEHSCKEHNEDGVATCTDEDDFWIYKFNDPKTKEVELKVRRLRESGRRQSYELAAALPKWLHDHGYAPISRVETKDPRQPNYESRTQNPFQTVYPLVNALEKNNDGLPYVRLKLMNTVDYTVKDTGKTIHVISEDELTYDALKDNRGDYSTVMCWDCQGLWGDKVKNPKTGKKEWPDKAAEGSALAKLVPGQVSSNPDKCDDIYILTYDSATSEFTVAHHLNLPNLVNDYNINIDKNLYVDGKDSTK